MINPESTPDHVAIIMDGNGRWASKQGKLRTDGHKAGTENLRRIIRAFSDAGVSYLTLYAFSTENWNRPQAEVQFLLEILTEIIVKETVNLHKEGVRIKHLGRLDRLSHELQSAITKSVEMPRDNQGITLSGAFDYGGRTEILDAVKGIISDKITPGQLSNELFKRYLYTDNMPDPDLIIRTAGEMRISNFLLWQSAYSEYYTTNVLWPDFNEIEVQKALKEYAKRSRKFGNIPELESP